MIQMEAKCEGTGGAPSVAGFHQTSSSPSKNLNNNSIIINNNNSNNNLTQSTQKNVKHTTTRERVQQAVEYYNSNVLRARIGAGLATTRNSVNEKHLLHGRSVVGSRFLPNPDNLYRSNSSLELLHENCIENHENHIVVGGASLRREYGSHGSIDVISSDRTPTTGESFFAMLQDYRPAVLGVIGTDQRSPGPSEYLKGKVVDPHCPNNHSNQHHSDSVDKGSTGSPKLRMKLQRLWGPNKPAFKQGNQIPSLDDNNIPMNSYNALQCTSISAADIEERQRRRAFAHYDCQSLTANLGYAAKLRGVLLARRRNTTTGASAASMLSSRSATPDSGENGDEDYGDGHSNELLESCPFFRNEVGGEEEREVSLTRVNNQNSTNYQRRAIHRPVLSCGVSILECNHGEILWKETTCPFQKGNRPIESIDNGAKYYRQYFLGQEHQNWFGMDEQLGPVAISIKREKLHDMENQYQFRMIIRTSELLTLRGSIVEEAIPNPRGIGKSVTTKEVLEHVTPEVQINCLRLGNNTSQCEQQLLKLDEQGLTNKYKIGILYCKSGQSSEEDMYNNEEAGPAFEEFLNLVGKKVRLKGFEHYKAGLDNKTDSTGTHSLYTTYQDCEVMFHVSTMLPFTPNNRQQLLRKRHIGNDIVTIVFQDPGAQPFTPKNIRSQFQHVFIIVRVINPCTENTHYRVAVSRSKEVPVFGPPIYHNAHYPKGKQFAEFLLAKVINAENAAHRSEKFATMATRTRQEYLKDLCTNYITAQLVDTGQKFSIFPNKKKEKPKIRFSGDSIQRGAFCWQVVLHDRGQSTKIDCFLGISAETFILIEESTRQIVFVTPCRSILGWSTNGNSLRIYHHQGEIVTIHMRDVSERDEQLEVIERLRAVTQGCGTIELNLRRNNLGQLGFHVQPDGVVTQVEISGLAWTAGLRQGYRLVEICKIAVVTLSHDQMVDLLKTSAQVTVTVIESFTDNAPRRGCVYPSCKFNMNNYESEYENMGNQNGDNTGNVVKSPSKKMIAAAQLQPPGNHRRRYERNFSPPRSSNSSGYGTGSSSRSFAMPNEPIVNSNSQNSMSYSNMGTLTSSSSGHSSNDERWYDISEAPEYNTHTKVSHASNSLPLTVRPLSVHENKMPVTNVDQRPLPRTANIEYLIKCAPKRTDDDNHMDTVSNSTAQNDPIYSKFEEDDLTNAELLITMRSFQIQKNKQYQQSNSSSANSRNNSPRLNGEAKLRTTRGNSSTTQNQRNSVNYASSTFKEDLMKLINPDYMKVSDDNFHQGAIKPTKPQKNSPNSHSLGNISNLAASKPNIITDDLILLKKKSRSREGINLGHHPASLGNFNIPKMISDDFKTIEQAAGIGNPSDVIRATARPATIISINNNSSTSNSNHHIGDEKNEVLHIKEDHVRRSPKHHHSNSQQLTKQQVLENAEIMLNSKHLKNINWNNLMETESSMMQHDEDHLLKPIQQNDIYESIGGTSSSSSPNPLNHQQHQKQHSNQYEPPSSKSVSPSTTSTTSCNSNTSIFIPPSASLPELQSQVSQLEERVIMETKRRKSLESTVKRLTEENRRLQDESQAAVQQLRRFTEWFFQTIDRPT